jgi:phage-related protein
MEFNGSITKTTNKILSSTLATLVASISRLISYTLDTTWTGYSAVLDTAKAAGIYLISFSAATIEFAGSLTRKTSKLLSADLTGWSGAVIKTISVSKSATNALFDGSITKLTSRLLSATTNTLDASLDALKAALGVVFSASMALLNGSLVKQTSKTFTGTTTYFNGIISKRINKIFNATKSLWAGLLRLFKFHGVVPPAAVICTKYLLSPITTEISLLSPIAKEIDLEGNLCW